MFMRLLRRWRQPETLLMPTMTMRPIRITVNWLGSACLWEAIDQCRSLPSQSDIARNSPSTWRRPVRVTCGERWGVYRTPECFEGPELLVDFHEGVLTLTDIDLVLWVVRQAVRAAIAAETP